MGTTQLPSRTSLPALALCVLLGLGAAAAAGFPLTGTAAAVSDGVQVSTAVPLAGMSVTACADIDMGLIAVGALTESSTCQVTFGSDNDASIRLAAQEVATNAHATDFFEVSAGQTIQDKSSTCATAIAAGVNEAGMRITATSGASISAAAPAWTCTASAVSGQQYRGIPDNGAAANLCDSGGLLATSPSCTTQFAISQANAGSQSVNGVYTGFLEFFIADV